MYTPTDIANQSLDAAGIEFTLGDIEEGSRAAQVILRAYGQCLRQLLRAAHWGFARKQIPMQLLADATGNTPNVGTVVPVPWAYEYGYPEDCMKARFVPWNQAQQQAAGIPPGNIALPATPISTALGQPPLSGSRIVPARFLETMDFNYVPAQAGSRSWETPGVSPDGRTVILTNVQNAQLVYTAFIKYPSNWDALFRAAFVSYLASEIALPLHKDKKLAMAVRPALIESTKHKLTQARITDGNEGWQSAELQVDWMRFRASGGALGGNWTGWGGGAEGAGPGILWGGWDSCAFSNGSAY